MELTYLKNPIILGILAAVITYLYFYWTQEKKYKKDPKIKRRPISILTPGAVGLVVWFLASSYFDRNITITASNIENIEGSELPKTVSPGAKNYKIVSDSSIGSRSYHLIGKNKVRLPPTDVFIDVARF